ncbi:Exodeoxyribonuclease VII small subunit [Desulfonatronum thiosulfatophilum]|uniref:Exodeoxyribonuclease 7 small subunit n=1 Tax=Desulfonatronum thiosulfatophilum TaxID=617002 RepID=A0A1G6B7V2_9BACT|nr:exodeoxyribonuclease VII small subunit [Desulfonatronum thiosulfatophilum]SDB16701.1 Exodeoxyribonuclease VII small subunit [Desulfonatronum thiosulfatophilum]
MSAKKKEPGFDARLADLQRIVARLEGEDLPLEEGVALFKDGVALAKSCRRQLDTARNEVMILSQGLLEPFEQTDGTVDLSSAFPESSDDESIPF